MKLMKLTGCRSFVMMWRSHARFQAGALRVHANSNE
jgi:hypothetical protein